MLKVNVFCFFPHFFFLIVCIRNLLSVSDGLMDCVDPDCCEQLSCGSDPFCHGSPDPLALLQQIPLPPTTPTGPRSTHTHSFYRRIRFLLGKSATHTLPGDVPFDTRYALVYSLCAWVCVYANSFLCISFLCLHPWNILRCSLLKDSRQQSMHIYINELKHPFHIVSLKWVRACAWKCLHVNEACRMFTCLCIHLGDPWRLASTQRWIALSSGISVRLQPQTLCLLLINA